jgi:hypothetical protein
MDESGDDLEWARQDVDGNSSQSRNKLPGYDASDKE